MNTCPFVLILHMAKKKKKNYQFNGNPEVKLIGSYLEQKS